LRNSIQLGFHWNFRRGRGGIIIFQKEGWIKAWIGRISPGEIKGLGKTYYLLILG